MRIDFSDPCLWCGGEIDREKPHSIKRLYCSPECSRAHYHQLEKDARLEAKAGRPPCKRCGSPVAVTKDARAIFCSPQCQNAGGQSKTCLNCGKRFKGSSRRKFCTMKCAALHRERSRAAQRVREAA